MRAAAAALVVVAGLVGGCTSVRVVQRDGCWVRQTEGFGKVSEELGPCSRPPPAWEGDRYTRLVQECVAQSDYRWQQKALAAWTKREAVPEKDDEEQVLKACQDDAGRMALSENEGLKERVAQLTGDRERLQTQSDQMASMLGEAAKKPAGSAVATASAKGDGSSSTKNDSNTETTHATDLATSGPVVVPPVQAQPVRVEVRRVSAPAPKKAAPKASCPVPAKKDAAKPTISPVSAPAPSAEEPQAQDCSCPAPKE